VPAPTRAQLTPPQGIYQWSGAVSEEWIDGGNWVGGNAPGIDADVLFGSTNTPPPEGTWISTLGLDPLRSLWIDASSGINYGFEEEGITLGSGLDYGAHMNMVTLLSNGQQQEEAVIATAVSFVNLYTAYIENYSEMGLVFTHPVSLKGYLRISGSGATHFRDKLNGKALIETWHTESTPTHLVLSGKNEDWSGLLTVNEHTLAFLKSDYALGTGMMHQVKKGGTLGFRSHVNSVLNYETPKGTLLVSGTGAVRRTGKPAVGAIYSDGGLNMYSGNIVMLGDAWFGARGERQGLLLLSGKITGANYSFTKVGPGLIYVTNPSNLWKETHINAGVLGFTDSESLGGGATPIVFGGGMLGLVSDTGNGSFAADIGTGSGEVRWAGSGGFAALAGDHTVSLNGGATLTVGDANFLQPGQRFLLSSRYSYNAITLVNDRNIENTPMIVEVERGQNANAFAVLQGTSYNASGAQSYYQKWGEGLLWDQSTHEGASPNY